MLNSKMFGLVVTLQNSATTYYLRYNFSSKIKCFEVSCVTCFILFDNVVYQTDRICLKINSIHKKALQSGTVVIYEKKNFESRQE